MLLQVTDAKLIRNKSVFLQQRYTVNTMLDFTVCLCQPMVIFFIISSDTLANQYDSDHEQWDEPLKRRFTSAPIEPTKSTAGTQTLITVPYCRDPTQPVAVLPPDDIPKTVRTPSLREDMNRPTVYKKKPDHTPNYYQPPSPWVPSDDTNILESSAPVLRKTNFSRSLYGVDQPDMPNPIRELQALAKSTNDVNDGDNPPFNFQAMLKKTPRNRASMKRHGERESDILEKKSAPPKHILAAGKKSPAPAPPKFANKEFVRTDSRELILSALKKKDSSNDLANAVGNKHSGRIVLGPGITIEGTVIDL